MSIFEANFRAIEDKVAEFIHSFGASLDMRVWVTLIREEFAEVKEAFESEDKAAQLKEVCDLIYVTAGLGLTAPDEDVIERLIPVEEREAIERLLHEVSLHTMGHQDFVTFEVFTEAFNRVHASNMSKLGDDGKPIRREDGKILKGPNYKAPDLTDLV